MFLLFVVIIAIICWFANQIKWYNFDKKREKQARRDGKSRYIDRNGDWVDLETGVPYKIDNGIRISSKEGELFEYGDVKYVSRSGRTIRNLSQEWRDKRALERAEWKNDAIQRGEKYYLYDLQKDFKEIRVGDMPHFEGYKAGDLPEGVPMWASVETNRRYFILSVTAGMPAGNLLWSVDSRKIEGILDEDVLPKKNVEVLNFIMQTVNSYKKNWDKYDFKNSYNSGIHDYSPEPYRENTVFYLKWSEELHNKEIVEIEKFNVSPFINTKIKSEIPY